jgi:hypothetical protein
VEVISRMSRLCPAAYRENELSKQMVALLKYRIAFAIFRDANKWVKAQAYKSLGEFIETLREPHALNQ